MGYCGIKQQLIYYTKVQEIDDSNALNIRKTRKSHENSYKKSNLQPNAMEAIHKQLSGCMQKDKLYLNPTLSLADLSETMNIPAHHITQTLNEYAKVNFYDFVNGFRVEAFKCKIKSGDALNFSLLGIALDCGFNSKSSFNRIFKNFTGQSPSEYKNSNSSI